MKMVTVGILSPPKVPTLPCLDIPAAAYPARKLDCAVLNTNGLRFLISSAPSGVLSTIAKSMSGLAFAAATVASASRKPTVMMLLHLASTIDWMFLAKSAALEDSTWPVSIPSSSLASVRPL